MTVQYRDAQNTALAAVASINVNKPTGLAQFDAAGVIVGRVNGVLPTPPAGWLQFGAEQIQGTAGVSYWKRIVGASEPTWTFASAGASFMQAQSVAAFSDASLGLAFSAFTVGQGTATTSFVAPAIITLAANAFVVSMYDTQSVAVSWTGPGTERLDVSNGAIYTETVASPGSIGTRTGTSSVATNAAFCVFAIEEVPWPIVDLMHRPFWQSLMAQ